LILFFVLSQPLHGRYSLMQGPLEDLVAAGNREVCVSLFLPNSPSGSSEGPSDEDQIKGVLAGVDGLPVDQQALQGKSHRAHHW